MKNLRLELGTLGIIEGDKKRFLESYIDSRLFRQRKTYDEYYIDVTAVEVNMDLGLLMILAEQFKVLVLDDCVILSDKI
jgi:hypothetical protein|tara:strand:- start:237 stop:473 length:237 start_codon:yes stop_codon:yes gene_type:complete